jgi:hypothetical protein
MDFLELSTAEWKVIAQMSKCSELLDYLEQFESDRLLILQPIGDPDTGKQVAVEIDEEERLERLRMHWEERKAVEANLPTLP